MGYNEVLGFVSITVLTKTKTSWYQPSADREWTSSPPLVAADLIAHQGTESPTSGRMRVKKG